MRMHKILLPDLVRAHGRLWSTFTGKHLNFGPTNCLILLALQGGNKEIALNVSSPEEYAAALKRYGRGLGHELTVGRLYTLPKGALHACYSRH